MGKTKDFTDQQCLESIYGYILKNMQEVTSDKHFMVGQRKKESKLHEMDADEIFQYMVDFYGYNKLPMVISAQKYNSHKGHELYRGYLQKEFVANYLVDFNYHYGAGLCLNGSYFSLNLDTARTYASTYNPTTHTSVFTGEVLRAKLDNSAQVALEDYIEFDIVGQLCSDKSKREILRDVHPRDRSKMETLLEFLDMLPQKHQQLFLKIFRHDISKAAIYLGYDAISNPYNNVVVILNRGKLLIDENYYKNICQDSQKYGQGVINFGADDFVK